MIASFYSFSLCCDGRDDDVKDCTPCLLCRKLRLSIHPLTYWLIIYVIIFSPSLQSFSSRYSRIVRSTLGTRTWLIGLLIDYIHILLFKISFNVFRQQRVPLVQNCQFQMALSLSIPNQLLNYSLGLIIVILHYFLANFSYIAFSHSFLKVTLAFNVRDFRLTVVIYALSASPEQLFLCLQYNTFLC